MKGYQIDYEHGAPKYISELNSGFDIDSFISYLKSQGYGVPGKEITVNRGFKVPVKTVLTKEEASQGRGRAYYCIQGLYKPCVYMAEEDTNMMLFDHYYRRRNK